MAWEIFEDCIKVESPCNMPFLRQFSWTMDETDRDSTDCKVLSTDANVALDTSEVVDYLENATMIYEGYHHCSIVKPKGGTLLLYDLERDEAEWENNKKKLRSVIASNWKYDILSVNIIILY